MGIWASELRGSERSGAELRRPFQAQAPELRNRDEDRASDLLWTRQSG